MRMYWITLPFLMILLLPLFQGASAGPFAVSGDINIPSDTPIEKVSDNVTIVRVQGGFAINEKTFPHTFASIDAELSISMGNWEALLSQTTWSNVQRGEDNPFTVTITVPRDATIGMTASYTLYLVFTDTTGAEVGTTQENFMVRVDRVSISGNDDDDDIGLDDDDDLNVSEDESIPILPIFGIGVLIVIVVGLIWFFKNYELVRETEGERKIHLREKDTGRILGKKGRN